jgi:UDPglucose 6-dehydrogenase
LERKAILGVCLRISIIGSGMVGGSIGKALSSENQVIFNDLDNNVLKKFESEGFTISPNIEDAIKNSDVSFVSVPTPTSNNKIDTSFIEKAAKECGRSIKNKDGFHVFIVKSTIIPTTTEKIIIPLIEEHSGKKNGKGFGVLFNPEFLTEISCTWTDDKKFEKSPFSEEKIVIGEGKDKKAGDIAVELFKQFDAPIFRTDYKTAEFTKYASNCCLLSRLSYWNEIFLIAEELGIDAQYVANLVAMDKRIGKYGSILGKAAGGKCLEKDALAFLEFVKDYHEPLVLNSIVNTNIKMAERYGRRE